jgi:hypothetical protein
MTRTFDPDKAGQTRTKPDIRQTAYPDNSGHTSIGVSGCPGVMSDVRVVEKKKRQPRLSRDARLSLAVLGIKR